MSDSTDDTFLATDECALNADVLQLVAARLPSRSLVQARVVCKAWARIFTSTSRIIYVQQSTVDMRRVLATLPSLGAITLRNLGNEDSFASHLSAIVEHGAAVTRLVLEQCVCARGAGRPAPGAVPLPARLRSIEFTSTGAWNDALLSGLSAVPQLTRLAISRVSLSQCRSIPWRTLSRLKHLKLRLSPDEQQPQPHAPLPPQPTVTSGAAAAVRGGPNPGNLEDVHTDGSAGALVYALASLLPALQHLRLLDLPNPADDPSVATLLATAAAAATAVAPQGGRLLASAFGDSLLHLELAFLDAADDCDYLCAAGISLDRQQRWRAGGKAGLDECKGHAGGKGGSDGTGLCGAVELGVHVIVVTNNQSSSASSSSSSGGSSSDSGSDSRSSGCRSSRSVSSRRGAHCRLGVGTAHNGGRRRGPQQGAVDDLTDDVAGAIKDLLSNLGLRLLVESQAGYVCGAAAGTGDAGVGSDADPRLAAVSTEGGGQSAGASPGAMTVAVVDGAAAATALQRSNLDQGSSGGGRRPDMGCRIVVGGPSATTPGGLGWPARGPHHGCPPGPPLATLTRLEVVLCCDHAAGVLGSQPLAMDLRQLPALSSMTLRLFSNTAAMSFSRGCEMQLQGLDALTSLQLLRSDGSAAPPELGGGLAAALAREAPRLRRLVVDGAVFTVAGPRHRSSDDAVAAEAARTAAMAAACERPVRSPAARDAASGTCSANLAELSRCTRLEYLKLRLLPNCRLPRYSQTVRTAWLPPSLTRLELSHLDLDTWSQAPPEQEGQVRARSGCEEALSPPQPPAQLGESQQGPTGAALEDNGHTAATAASRSSSNLPHLAHVQLQFCRIPELLSLSDAADLSHLSLSNCTAPGATAAAIAARWPHLQLLSVSSPLAAPAPPRVPGQQQQQPPSAYIIWLQHRVEGHVMDRDASMLQPEDVEALGALTGLRSLFWHAPHAARGLSSAALTRLSCLSGLRRLSLHLGYDNSVVPEQLLQSVACMDRLVELDVVVGHGPCRAVVGCGSAGAAAGERRAPGDTEAGSGTGSLSERLATALPNALVHIRRD